MTRPKRKAGKADVLAAVRAAAGATGWRICRRCGELSVPPGLATCVACVRFTTRGAR